MEAIMHRALQCVRKTEDIKKFFQEEIAGYLREMKEEAREG